MLTKTMVTMTIGQTTNTKTDHMYIREKDMYAAGVISSKRHSIGKRIVISKTKYQKQNVTTQHEPTNAGTCVIQNVKTWHELTNVSTYVV